MDLTTYLLIGTVGTAVYTICLWGGMTMLRRNMLASAAAAERSKTETRTTANRAHQAAGANRVAWGDS